MSEIYTLPQLKRVLTPVFDAYGVRKAILFGSYAKGTATEKSDIDLLVQASRPSLCGPFGRCAADRGQERGSVRCDAHRGRVPDRPGDPADGGDGL